MIGLTSMFVVVTGIQYWCTDYFIHVLEIPQTKAYSLFMFVGIVGPTAGIISAGLVFDKIGGYLGTNAIPVCAVFGFVAMIMGLMSAYLVEPIHVAVCLTIELFCGGFTMPAATGIMLNFIPPNMRTMGNSMANISYNLFGYLPAPLLYGIAYQYGGSGRSHLGMWTIQCFTCVAFSLNIIAYFRFKITLNSVQEDLEEMLNEAKEDIPQQSNRSVGRIRSL